LAKSDQEFTDSHVKPATDEDIANLAIPFDMATRGLSSFLLGHAAKVGQSPLRAGRISTHVALNSLLNDILWQVAERAAELPEAVNEYRLSKPTSFLLHLEAARALQPLSKLKILAKRPWCFSAVTVFSETCSRQLGRIHVCLSERLEVAASAKEITLAVGYCIGTAQNLREHMGFLELAQQDLGPFAVSDQGGNLDSLGQRICAR
jgi:hypothetical protein